jgi:pimeloyl-ACP methyl ester carboxylesterase
MNPAAMFCALLGALAPVTSGAAEARHRVLIEGRGALTVVFEAGLGDTLEVWQRVQGRVAGCTRTFAYTRAGYPGSPRARGARDAATLVAELRAELAARQIAPPYLLAGHSMGGLYMEYFARRYPEEVAGLVLVDATHWAHLERMRAESPGTWRTVKAVSILMSGIMRRELEASAAAGAQLAELPAGSVPTIVLSSTRAAPGELPSFRALLHRLQDETAAANDTRRHEFIDGSGHYIQRDRPEVVIRAIEELAGC